MLTTSPRRLLPSPPATNSIPDLADFSYEQDEEDEAAGSAEETARYIADMVGALASMAGEARLDLLTYLLNMARVEAELRARKARLWKIDDQRRQSPSMSDTRSPPCRSMRPSISSSCRDQTNFADRTGAGAARSSMPSGAGRNASTRWRGDSCSPTPARPRARPLSPACAPTSAPNPSISSHSGS